MSPAEHKMRLPGLVWSPIGATILMALLMLPIYGPMLPTIEGGLWPVTGKVEFIGVTEVDGGVTARLKYTKYRDCEYLGASLDANGMPVDFEPVAGGEPITVGTGERLSRPFFIGTKDLAGLRLRWLHRCSPYWLTVTVGYP